MSNYNIEKLKTNVKIHGTVLTATLATALTHGIYGSIYPIKKKTHLFLKKANGLFLKKA